MAKVNVKKSINIPANDAWNELSSFKGIENYSPIAKSVTQGSGHGATRVCTMPDGAKINEELNIVDNAKKHFRYSITSGPFPITNYVSDVMVKPLDEKSCEVEWACNFDSDAQVEGEMKKTFEGFYNTIIGELETYIKK